MAGEDRIRLDKWLWQARAFRSRGLAAAAITAGRVRINGAPTLRPAHAVGPGDVLTFAQGNAVRLWRIRGPGTRRGPASEAQQLYEDLDDGGTGASPQAGGAE